MKITKQLEAPASFIYEQIINSVIFDIRKATGETLRVGQLEGYEYKKQFGKNQSGRIKITRAILNEAYAFETLTTRSDYTVSYELKALTDTSCEITYTEEATSHGFFNQINDMFVGTLLGWLKRKQIPVMFDAMVKQYKG